MAEKNYTNKIGIDTSEFTKAIKESNANLKVLAQQINQTRLSTIDYNTAISSLEKNVTEHKNKLGILQQKYERLKNALGDNAKATKAVEAELEKEKNAVISSEKALDDYKKGLNNTSDTCKDICHALTMMEMAFYDVAKTIVTKTCKALVDFTKETINTGMQFESAFAGVRKVTSGTEEDFKELENEIRQTALEKPISADQLASIYQMGSQLGIAKDSLKDFSDSIIDLAKTSNLTEEAGATMIAQYANVMHLPSEDYRRFASTLSYLGSTTATTESTIMEFMSRLSGAGATIGLTHQDLLALSTAMGSVGINVEAGGSAISTILSKVSMDVDKNSDTLTTWAEVAGTTAEQFKKAWKEDTMSAIQAVIQGMGDAKKGGESLNLILDDLGINNIRQLDTMRKLANASELLAEDMKKANTEWQSASFLGESASQVYNTVESQLQLLKNSFSEMKMSIYDGFKKPLAEAMGELGNFLKSNDAKKFAKEFSDTLSGIAKIAVSVIKTIISNFDKLIAIIRTAIKLIPMIVTQKVLTGIFSFVSAIQKAGGAMALFNKIVLANPLNLLIAAISAVVVGIGTYCYKTLTATSITKEHIKELEAEKNQLEANREERERVITGIESEFNYTQNLINKLKECVDENGKVKDGYQDRINHIIPLIQQATGTEIKLINGQIVKYNELISTLEDVIKMKRLEAKISAYQGDYNEAIRAEEEHGQDVFNIQYKIRDAENRLRNEQIKEEQEIAKKREELEKNGVRNIDFNAKSNRKDNINAIKDEIEELKKEKDLIDKNAKERKDIIDKYENLIKEQYEKTNFKSVGSTDIDGAADAGAEAGTAYATNYSNAVTSGAKSTSKAVKEESKTTYNDLLALEKQYTDQLNDYITKIKQGSAEVTVEMVEETKKNLNDVQSKIKSMKELLGEETVVGKVVLDDESYGALKAKEKELQDQLLTMQEEIARGNQNVTSDMLDNVSKQIDSVQSKMKALQNEWSEFGEDGEIADDFISENTNLTSKGVIFGKGVLGDNAVEFEGAGKDAAVSYLEGYRKKQEEQREAMQEQIAEEAYIRANQEAISYQAATVDPANLDIYNQTELFLADSKQTAQATGLYNNAYKVSNAETWTLNQAINEAMKIDFSVIGLHICQGIANGIQANAHIVISAVRAMAEAAKTEASDGFEIGSPSKVFYRYGRFVDMGLANGIRDYASLIGEQMKSITSNINSSIDRVNANYEKKRTGEHEYSKPIGRTEINYNFTQNNNSNKSLDTLAIYQQSKSLLKRTVRNQYV